MCPQCDSHLGTNPKDLVRTDRTLQSIVDKVFPQFAQGGEPARRAEKRPSSPPSEGRAAKPPRQTQVSEEAQDEVSFSLQDDDPRISTKHGLKLEKPYLRTRAQLTVAHLRKYLARKMQLRADAELDILCRQTILPPEITLDRILKEHWKHTEDLILKYRVRFHSADGESGGTEGDEAAS